MSYVDLAFSTGIFILFFGVTMMMIVSFFLGEPESSGIEEFRSKATDLFDLFFSSEGSPKNWEDTGEAPSELGLVKTIQRVPIVLRETSGSARTHEPITERITFDEGCSKAAYNSTIRVYDDDLNGINFQINRSVTCADDFLNESVVRFLVNMTSGQTKRYWVYYYNETDIPAGYSDLTISTASWLPTGGDSWSDGTSDWSRYGGTSSSVEADSDNRWMGDSAVKINDTFDGSGTAGLEYNPSGDMDASSHPYIDAWLYVDNIGGVSVNVSACNGTDTLYTTVSDMSSGVWHHFESEIGGSDWEGQSFDTSEIDYVRFYMVNSTPEITRSLSVDEFHFELQPIVTEVYPAENVTIVSRKKVSALDNFTIDELRNALGEDYKFRVEITEG
jgi:hypothetical protein